MAPTVISSPSDRAKTRFAHSSPAFIDPSTAITDSNSVRLRARVMVSLIRINAHWGSPFVVSVEQCRTPGIRTPRHPHRGSWTTWTCERANRGHRDCGEVTSFTRSRRHRMQTLACCSSIAAFIRPSRIMTIRHPATPESTSGPLQRTSYRVGFSNRTSVTLNSRTLIPRLVSNTHGHIHSHGFCNP